MVVSREYKLYVKEERISSLPRSLYEKLARASSKILYIEPDEKTRKALHESIEFSHLKVTPEDVASLSILFTFFICFPTVILIILGAFGLPGISISFGLLIIFLSIPFGILMYMYPAYQRIRYQILCGPEMILFILYVSLYMRNIPNLEKAVEFAAKNMKGPLSIDIRKTLWQVETGEHINIHEALRTFTEKWRSNVEFTQAIDLIAGSLKESGERRIQMLDEATNLILEGSKEKTKTFARDMRLPLMAVNALGILLPIMVIVLIPVLTLFVGVEKGLLILFYNVLLPIGLYFLVRELLKKRPATFGTIEVEEKNPDFHYPMKIGKETYEIPLIPLALFIIVLFLILSYFSSEIISAILILGGISIGCSLLFILNTLPKMNIRQRIRILEQEFSEAIFQLGNRVASGVPIEMAIENIASKLTTKEAKSIFLRATNNMKLGLSFEKAFLDKDIGAIKYYPSSLIKSAIIVIIESGKKGVETLSKAMISVAKYFKNLYRTQIETLEQLSEILSTLKFQGFFLNPFICGIVNTLAIMMIMILSKISNLLPSISTSSLSIGLQGFLSFANLNISSFDFVLVIGIYLIEFCYIISLFINGIENGEDPIAYQHMLGIMLLSSYVVFVLTLFVSLTIFEPMLMGIFIFT